MLELIALILFGIFTFMKLAEKGSIAHWSWWKVTSPLWIYVIVAIVIYGFILGSIGLIITMAPTGF